MNALTIDRIVRRLSRVRVPRGERVLNMLKVIRASRLITRDPHAVLFVTSLLRAREIKLAHALREAGWKVILIYLETTPFSPEGHFDLAIPARSEAEAHRYAKALGPRICHVFSGAVDGLMYRLCADKPGPVVIDMNDIFCASLFDYCHERFEPTRECLERADGLCSRDLQPKSAQKLQNYRLPPNVLLFPEYSWRDGPNNPRATPKGDPEEVRVVSVGTFCLETQGMRDTSYLYLARLLTQQHIHLHIYPHWFYRHSSTSVFNFDLRKDFAEFFRLQETTPYLHIHESLPFEELMLALPQYDFGIVAGGNPAFGQVLKMLKQEYLRTCYSGRIADYLDARLPILINREVRFNFWLVKRYGLAVDLGGILQPDFRQRLLAIKKDPDRLAKVDLAARGRFSLEQNISRLTSFYKRIIEEGNRYRLRVGYPLSTATVVPLLGKPFRALETAIVRSNQMMHNMREALDAAKNEARRNRTDIEKLVATNRRLADEQRHLRYLLQHTLDGKTGVSNGITSGTTPEELRDPPNAEGLVAVSGANSGARREKRSLVAAKQSLHVERGQFWADELSSLLNWPQIRDSVEQDTGMPELLEMIRLFSAQSGTLGDLSSCWQVLGFKNFNQLISDGYRNFKRTIGHNYFNFLVQSGDPQITFLESQLDVATRKECRAMAAVIEDDPQFEWQQQESYRYFVLLLWTYARKKDVCGHLDHLDEPVEGNPLVVPFKGQRACQDLANSVLEYYSMCEGVSFENCARALEIGGGYGRNAYVILKRNQHLRYTIVDIPPALWIAQRYLSSIFRDRLVFHVRDFSNYEEVRQELETASLVFLLPHQLEMLPDRFFDLSLNISSFGEMRPQQIRAYFDLIERLTSKRFYMKQWKVSQNAFDHLALSEDDYPISATWRQIYSRTCAVQTQFFEALYDVRRNP